MTDNSSAPAYPALAFDKDGDESYVPGLSKREHFAAMVMVAMIQGKVVPFKGYAKDAVEFADDLLAELSKPQP